MKRLGLLVIACLMLGGCTTYYKVVDLDSQQHYYTTSVQKKSSGAVSFKDSRTGHQVTVQSSDVGTVSKEVFEHGE